jgi:hypothetical protein
LVLKRGLRGLGVAALAVVAGILLTAPASAQDMPAGAQTASSPGGVVFQGFVPNGADGNFDAIGAAPAAPAVSSGPGRPGDADLAKPWVMFTELAYNPTRLVCSTFVNPLQFAVSDDGKSVAFDVSCDDGRGYTGYHVTFDCVTEGGHCGPMTFPLYWFAGGYTTGMPSFKLAYTTRQWGTAKMRVCGIGGDGRCFERPPGEHPGGTMVPQSASLTVLEWPSMLASGLL